MLSGITNALFEANDVSWRQAILPVKDGGLGFRSAVHVHVASSAYLASAESSSTLLIASYHFI